MALSLPAEPECSRKLLPANTSDLAVTLPDRQTDPRPADHTGINERLFRTGSYREDGSQAAAGRPAAFVSQATDGGEWRSRKSMTDSWAGSQAVSGHACVYVCVQGTEWMTDWQGHGWARLHQHRRLL